MLAARGLLKNVTRVQLRQSSVVFRTFGAGGRSHLNPDGTRPEPEDGENYHDSDPLDYVPKLNTVNERGQKWIRGVPNAPMAEQWDVHQNNVPFWPRERLRNFGNFKLVMKAEFCFFYTPTFIILGFLMPAFTTLYTLEEAVATTMTVKVTGRQWYWVYEVESPTDDDDDE